MNLFNEVHDDVFVCRGRKDPSCVLTQLHCLNPTNVLPTSSDTLKRKRYIAPLVHLPASIPVGFFEDGLINRLLEYAVVKYRVSP